MNFVSTPDAPVAAPPAPALPAGAARIPLPRAAPRRVLAMGAWLKNAAALARYGEAIVSPVHGDLGDPAACVALEASVDALLRDHGPVDAVAHDLHPDFHSTRLGQALAQRLGVPAIAVQHHHAHVAVVQAEQGLDEPVIGLALDGVGLGTDGTAWGGELLRVDGPDAVRLGRLRPLRLPGGDLAAQEPWRVAAGVLHGLGRGDEIVRRWGDAVGESKAAGLRAMLDRDLNCPLTSSAGRWFDAAAAALDLSLRQQAEAEAAIALEALATRWLASHGRDGEFDLALAPVSTPGYGVASLHHGTMPVPMPSSGAGAGAGECLAPAAPHAATSLSEVDLRPLLSHLFALGDIARARSGHDTGDARGRGAALFHVGLADALGRWALAAAQREGCRGVVLAGGCFHNRLLGDLVSRRLRSAGLRVLRPQRVGCGDAGLALGQAWAAALAAAAGAPSASFRETSPCA